MAYSYNEVTASGATNIFSVPFPYLAQAHVDVKVDGVVRPQGGYTWLTTSTIQLPDVAGTLTGKKVRVYRTTPRSDVEVEYSSGGLDNRDLNNSARQLLYIEQEILDDLEVTHASLSDVILRAVSVGPGQTAPVLDLPAFYGKWLGIDGSGALIPVTPNLLPGSISAASIIDSTTAGRALLTAATVNAQRNLLGVREAINITPEAYGALGDGVTDDTNAVKDAAAAAITAGVSLQLAAGKTYLLSTWTPMVSATELRIVGNGAMLKGPASTTDFAYPNAKIDVRDVKFDRWASVFKRLLADSGSLVGSNIVGNTFTNITGIPINIERPVVGIVIESNIFSGNSGGIQVRIGANDYASQDTWSGIRVVGNTIKNITASGTASLFAVLIYGKDVTVALNTITGLLSDEGEAVGIYIKARGGVVVGNHVEDVNSEADIGNALDVVGISLKGSNRGVTDSGVQGFRCIAANNTVRVIGEQGVKGIGIRMQVSDSKVLGNLIEDVGKIGVANDNTPGSDQTDVSHNTVRGLNIVPDYGIYIATKGFGHEAHHNHVREALVGYLIGAPSGQQISNVTISGSVASTQTNAAGVRFATGGTIVGVEVRGLQMSLPASGKCFVNDGSISRLSILGGDVKPALSAGAAFWNGGYPTGLTMRNVRGVKNRSTGTATIANGAGETVAHGLWVTPTFVAAQPVTGSVKHQCHTAGASTFTITHDGGAPVLFFWEAETPYAQDAA